jgi:hypothetical protein
MTTVPRYPSLFQINTRVWLQRLSREAGKPIILADLDDTTIDGFAEKGFDWIWMLSVWQIGAAGRAVSRGNRQWRAEFEAILPDLTDDDIAGAGFAIPPTPSATRWVARRRWRNSAKGWPSAASSFCWTSCRTIPPPTIRG